MILGLNYAPELVGIGPYTAGLAEALAARGHEIQVVAGQPYYPEWQADPRYHAPWRPVVENGVTITRRPHYIPGNPTGVKRMAHHLSFASSAYPAVRRIMRGKRPELVLTVVPSMIAAPVALRMARKAGIPLWMHVQDFEVGAALATGLLDAEGRAAIAANRFEGKMLRSADIVSSISTPMCELLAAKGVPGDRIVEINNWANHAGAIETADGERLRREWGLGDKTVALYSGNIGNKQGLDVVIDAARSMAGREDVVFVIAGDGPSRAAIEKRAEGLPNVLFRDLVPDAEVGDLLTMADIHLLPQLPDAADLVLPSKLGNMLASGRPVVATVRPGTGIAREIVDCGIVVPPENPEAIVSAISALVDHPDYRETMGRAAKLRAATAWAKERVIDRFEDTLERVLG